MAARSGSGTGELSIRYRYTRLRHDSRASKSPPNVRASRTATSGPHSRFTDRASRAGSAARSEAASKDTTWPAACTPRSVRPAQAKSTSWPSTRPSASERAPATVGTPWLRANPQNGPPL